jgi:PQ loop repeat
MCPLFMELKENKIPIDNGVDWPAKIFGALGLVFIAAGLIPPYIDIYKVRRVRGFSFIFLLVDMGGAFFSLLSLRKILL